MATTTITTIEDLMRVLDENPEWLEALRTRLLTRELIELPRRFAEFAASVDQRFDEQGKAIARLEERMGGVEERVGGVEERVGGLEQRSDEHTQTLAEHGKILNEHTQTLAEHGKILNEHTQTLAEHGQMLTDQGKAIARLEERVGEHSAEFVEIRRQFQLLRDDVGDLKGSRAEEEAAEDIDFIAEELGLSFVRVLTRDDLKALLLAQPLPDLERGVRHSFTKADLVAEAADESGETRYIAVEASYTVNGRDTDRALRNAEILTRLTGKPAQAVVAGYRLDDRVRARIESGEVYWRELEH